MTNTSQNTLPALDEEGGMMTIWEHLDELRSRLLRSIISLVVAFVVALIFASDIIRFLAEPYTDLGGRLQNLEPTGNVVMYFRVSLMSAGIIAIPYITYQLFMFAAPGLTRKEKGTVLRAIPFTTAFFMLGVAFAWFIMVPAAFEFLFNFQSDVFENQWTAQRYFSFLTSVLFWIGVAFEMPIVLYVMARLGLVGAGTLIKNWRLAIVLMSIIAALITPTVDPFNMLLVMAPLIVLYILSIVLVAIAERGLKRRLAASDQAGRS
ncbi:MAG: twin-arginine translocase subunit TatC [Chloroflexi bacterium]|nr:twin-arginine translocase subunit TatC [Chloroflexota bacterium]